MFKVLLISAFVAIAAAKGPATYSGDQCTLPFKYRGKTYSACTTASDTNPWCATGPEDYQIGSGKFAYCCPSMKECEEDCSQLGGFKKDKNCDKCECVQPNPCKNGDPCGNGRCTVKAGKAECSCNANFRYNAEKKSCEACKENVCKNSNDILSEETCYTFHTSSNYDTAPGSCEKIGASLATITQGSSALKAIAEKAWGNWPVKSGSGYIRVTGKKGKGCAILLGTTKYSQIQYLENYCNRAGVTVCQYKSQCKAPKKCLASTDIQINDRCYRFSTSASFNTANNSCKKITPSATLANLSQGSKALTTLAERAWKRWPVHNKSGYIRINGKQGNGCATLFGSTKYATIEHSAVYCNRAGVTICEY